MAIRTQEFWACAERVEWKHHAGEFEIRLLNWNPVGMEQYMLIRPEPYLITIDIPDSFDMRSCQADAIRAQIKKVEAEAQNLITKLTAELNSILAIEA